MQKTKYKSFVLSETGRRNENQDNAEFFANTHGYAVSVLADGMGGHYGGRQASTLAIQLVKQAFVSYNPDPNIDEETFAIEWLKKANKKVNEGFIDYVKRYPAYSDMGTTLVIGIVVNGKTLCVSNVGDSRMYVYQSEKLSQVTKDQNMMNKLLDEYAGSDTAQLTHELKSSLFYQNVLYSSIGIDKKTIIDVYKFPLEQKATLVLTSDGIHDSVDTNQFVRCLEKGTTLKSKAKMLSKIAYENGSTDNMTTLIVEIE